MIEYTPIQHRTFQQYCSNTPDIAETS